MVDQTNTETLDILLCSDKHESWAEFDKLAAQEKPVYDFVFLSGDQANGDHPVDVEENKVMLESNKRSVETLSKLVKENGKVIYIPGNHDAEILFKADAPKIENSENVHNRVVELAPGLLVAGLGGSLPTLYKPGGTHSTSEWQNSFPDYPFSS